MKLRLLSFLAALAAIASLVGVLDWKGIIDLPFLSDTISGVLATVPTSAAVVYHFLMALGDKLDDGEANGSFKPKLFAIALLLGLCCLMPSCAALGSAISKQPIHTTAVQRADGAGPSFELATSDLLKAEQDSMIASTAKVPRRQWGLYDAGYLAAKATEVIDSGK